MKRKKKRTIDGRTLHPMEREYGEDHQRMQDSSIGCIDLVYASYGDNGAEDVPPDGPDAPADVPPNDVRILTPDQFTAPARITAAEPLLISRHRGSKDLPDSLLSWPG